MDSKRLTKKINAGVSLFLIGAFSTFAQDQLPLLIEDIKNSPLTYISQDAISYFQRTGHQFVSGNKDDALRGFRAAIKLGELGKTAINAVPALIDQFPTAIHVAEIKNVRYAGEGTFDDWISTYVMNEKNKFMLASPFMDYNGMSICEQYIDAVPKTAFIERTPLHGSVIKAATVDITITFTVFIGSCALSRITGMTIGNNQNDWRLWWAQNGNNNVATNTSTISASPQIIASGLSFGDIVEKGKYRMSLTTGDELVGFVESKDDTSLIFETVEGKPYMFNRKLIGRCDLVDLPKTLQKKSADKTSKVNDQNDSLVVSFDSLLQKSKSNMLLEVTLSNGSLFKGRFVSIDQSLLKINIEGSVIPMSKDVILRITIIIPASVKQQSSAQAVPQVLDTVIGKSNVVDDWGNSKPDIIWVGIIVKDGNTGVSLKIADSTVRFVKHDDIVRVIRHSQDNNNDPIKRYAKPLMCPQGMVLVDLPPGTQGRPFFKTCIDKYEYPNREGTIPQSSLSYTDAQKLCEQQGKRLCTADEWQWACSSIDALPYPYGKSIEENRCNSDASRGVEPSGARLNCFSKFGAFDMVGNVFEWVTASNKQPALMGGPYSKCQTVSPGIGGEAKSMSGLRCCKSN